MVTIAGIAAGMRKPANLPLLQTLVLLREGFLKSSVLTPSFSIYFCLHFIQILIYLQISLRNCRYIRRYFFKTVLTMHSTEVQAKPLFSWKARVGHCSTFGFSLLCYRPLFTQWL